MFDIKKPLFSGLLNKVDVGEFLCEMNASPKVWGIFLCFEKLDNTILVCSELESASHLRISIFKLGLLGLFSINIYLSSMFFDKQEN